MISSLWHRYINLCLIITWNSQQGAAGQGDEDGHTGPADWGAMQFVQFRHGQTIPVCHGLSRKRRSCALGYPKHFAGKRENEDLSTARAVSKSISHRYEVFS